MGKFEMPTKRRMAAPFQSKEAFVDFLRAPRVNDGHVPIGDERWSNKDLEPTPVEQRTWTWYSLPLYWFSNKFSLVGWNTGSSLVAVGLVWYPARLLIGRRLIAYVDIADILRISMHRLFTRGYSCRFDGSSGR